MARDGLLTVGESDDPGAKTRSKSTRSKSTRSKSTRDAASATDDEVDAAAAD